MMHSEASTTLRPLDTFPRAPQLRITYAAAYTLACSQRAMVEKAFGATDAHVQDRASQWAIGMGNRLGLSVRAVGLDKIDWTKPCIVMANHQSYLDVFALFRTLPRAYGFVAKKVLFSVPAFGGVMRAVGCVPVDRGQRGDAVSSMRGAAAEISRGTTICVFPEGTRGPGDRVQRLKKGPFYLAQLAQVPVVPIGIRGSGVLMPRSNTAIYSGELEVHAGDPIAPIAIEGHGPRNQLATVVRAELSRLTGLPLLD